MIYGLRLPNQANPFGSFVNGHHFAALMEMTIGLTLGFLFSRTTEHVWRIFSGIAVFVMGIAIIFTSSRGGMLSLLAVIGFGVAANVLQKPAHQMDLPDKGEKNYRRIFLYLGGGLGVILTLIAAALLLSGDQFLLRGTGLTGQGDISNGRFHFWQIAWRIFLDYPLLGAGLESFAYAFPNYDTWNGFYRVEQAHNDYLQILAEAGILGFICVAAFIFLLFKQGLRIIRQSADSFRRDTAVGALAGCCGILVHSFFDFPLRTPANVFFFLTLAVLATVPLTTPKRLRKKRESYSFI
jgi:O-antigen ligase